MRLEWDGIMYIILITVASRLVYADLNNLRM